MPELLPDRFFNSRPRNCCPEQEHGRIHYDMKQVWKDGTKAIVISPLGFIARLCALVPPLYFNLTRFHGVLEPNAKLRSRVVPKPDTDDKKEQPPLQLELFDINIQHRSRIQSRINRSQSPKPVVGFLGPRCSDGFSRSIILLTKLIK